MGRKIIITGGSGFIGQALCTELNAFGYEVTVLSRRLEQRVLNERSHTRVVCWDPNDPEPWLSHASGACAIVNLAGDNIASSLRWTAAKKERLLQSRLTAGKAVSEAVLRLNQKPGVLIQASAIGYYGNREDEVLTEESGPGEGFLADLAEQWETCVDPVRQQGVRCATIRTGIVLGKGGGFLERVVFPFKLGLGGHLGNGQQWLSWIHLADEVSAIRFLIEHETLEGAFNLTAPNPLVARDFFKKLGRVLKRPSWLHLPAFMLRLMMGELASELLLSGQRVLPDRLTRSGYTFKYPDAFPALQSIMEET
jgi:uncharacterized protein (TIGR01777 family)